MGRNSKEEAQATRGSILEAATQLFWEKGVANSSLENIAERAGVTRGAIYWHFKNKCEIFSALHEQVYDSLLETILADLQNDHPQPVKQLEELCVALLLDLHTNESKRKIVSVIFLRCDYSGNMQYFLDKQNEQKAVSAELFSRYFHKAAGKGFLDKKSDPKIMTLALFCYITGIVFEYLRNPGLFDMDKQASQLISQFFNGIKTLK